MQNVINAFILSLFVFYSHVSFIQALTFPCNETDLLTTNCTGSICTYNCNGGFYNFDICFGCNSANWVLNINNTDADTCVITSDSKVFCKKLCNGCNETMNLDIYCSSIDPNICWIVDTNSLNLWPDTICVNITEYDSTTMLYTSTPVVTTVPITTVPITTVPITTVPATSTRDLKTSPPASTSQNNLVITSAPKTLCSSDNVTQLPDDETSTQAQGTYLNSNASVASKPSYSSQSANPLIDILSTASSNAAYASARGDIFSIDQTTTATTAKTTTVTTTSTTTNDATVGFTTNGVFAIQDDLNITTIDDTRVEVATIDNLWRRMCWDPPAVENSVTTLYKDLTGMVATYTCKPGHTFPAGEISRTIQCTGLDWFPEPTEICENVISCRLASLANIQPTISDESEFGDEQTVVCSGPDFRLNDGHKEGALKCVQVKVGYQRIGQFHKPASGCARRCQSLPLLDYANMVYREETRDVLLTCEHGHRMPDGKSFGVFKCDDVDDTWGALGPCEDIYCPALAPPGNGSLDSPGITYGTVVNAKCRLGFIYPDMTLAKAVKCVESVDEMSGIVTAVWNVTLPDCQRVMCNDPPIDTTSFRDAVAPPFEYNAVVGYSCPDGYKFSEGRTKRDLVCAETQQWSTTDITCAVGICDPVPDVIKAFPNTKMATKDTIVTFTCIVGFEFLPKVTTQNLTCDGTSWSTIKYPSCKVLNCPPLDVKLSKLSTTSNAYNSTVTVTCDKGYSFDGSANYTTADVTCLETARWTLDLDCQPIDCNKPPYIASALMSWVGTTFPTGLATYKCGEHKWFSRNTYEITATCSSDGIWKSNGYAKSQSWGSCYDILCPPAPSTTLDDELLAGTDVNVSCPAGSSFLSSLVKDHLLATCLMSGNWNPPIPECKATVPVYTAVQVEATGSTLMGSIAIGVIVTMILIMFLLDIPTFKVSFAQMFSNLVAPK